MCCVCVGYSFTTTTTTQKMKWIKATQLGNIPNKRSSHSITFLYEKIYLIGGELEPSVPIDIDDLFVCTDTSNCSNKVICELGI
jgi:hypothetical protein